MVELETIDQFSQFKEIESEWLPFADTVPGLTPFQLPAWQLTWWNHFGSGELHVMIFRDGNSMVGIIPAFLHSWNNKRQMTLIGSGISDYLDPAIAPGCCEAIAHCLRDHLRSVDYDVCDWQDLSWETPLKQVGTDKSYTLEITPDVLCTAIPLSGTFEEFWQARSKDLRRNIRRYGDRAMELGELQFQTTNEADPDLVNALIRLHAARWEKREQPGMIAANGSAEFLRDVFQRLACNGMLRLFSMRCNRKIVAVIAGFSYRSTMYSYLSGFDPEQEHLGFGRALLFEALRYSHENHYSAWNFLRGSEPYKYSWGAKDIPKCRLILIRRAQFVRLRASSLTHKDQLPSTDR